MISGGSLTLGLNSSSATLTTSGTNQNLTIDPNGTGAIYFHGSTYNLDSNGNLTVQKFVDSANSSYFLDPAASATSLATAGQAGIGNPNPVGMLDVSGGITGKALTILNEVGNQSILTASVSGVTKFTVDNSGDVLAAGQIQVGSVTTNPTAVGAGAMIFNTTTNTMQCYNGTNWSNCGGTLYSNTNASVANGSYITVTDKLNTTDILTSAWINSQSTWKLLNATYQPAIAWEGKDTEKGIYHNAVNSYVSSNETADTTTNLAAGLLYDTFEDQTKTDSANTTVSTSSTGRYNNINRTNTNTSQNRIDGKIL